jgi:hypothetical protein
LNYEEVCASGGIVSRILILTLVGGELLDLIDLHPVKEPQLPVEFEIG